MGFESVADAARQYTDDNQTIRTNASMQTKCDIISCAEDYIPRMLIMSGGDYLLFCAEHRKEFVKTMGYRDTGEDE